MTINSIKKHSHQIKDVLTKCENISSIIPKRFLKAPPYIFDFSSKNKELAATNLKNAKQFTRYITKTLTMHRCAFGIGGYGENRIIYQRSNLFKKDSEPRSVHLGVDIWMPAKTPIYSPLDATVHSFKDNNMFGDYGPTIILQHMLNGVSFYTLYGHLSRRSLKTLNIGMKIKMGQQIGTLGSYNENGKWPAHLHFQIISDLLGKKGDFPGVSTISKKKYFLTLCPHPNLILRMNCLEK